MTNDTSTLTGALRELGETMAANLTTQGVPSTYDEGLTTLAGKILDIQGGGGYTKILVSSSSDILSYYDEDSCTVTAQLADANDDPVAQAGVSIQLYKDNVLWDTIQTDNTGKVTKTYTSAGVGDVEFEATDGTLSSEIFVLEDCILYDSLTSASGKWTIPSGVTSSYSDEGWRISASSYKQIKLTDKLTSDCSVEFTLVDFNVISAGGSVATYIYTNGETTPNQEILYSRSSSYSTSTCFGVDIEHRLVTGAKYRTEFTTSTIKVYENNTLIGQATNNVGFPTRFEWHMGSGGRYAIYKDLKVKPL